MIITAVVNTAIAVSQVSLVPRPFFSLKKKKRAYGGEGSVNQTISGSSIACTSLALPDPRRQPVIAYARSYC